MEMLARMGGSGWIMPEPPRSRHRCQVRAGSTQSANAAIVDIDHPTARDVAFELAFVTTTIIATVVTIIATVATLPIDDQTALNLVTVPFAIDIADPGHIGVAIAIAAHIALDGGGAKLNCALAVVIPAIVTAVVPVVILAIIIVAIAARAIAIVVTILLGGRSDGGDPTDDESTRDDVARIDAAIALAILGGGGGGGE